MVTSRYKGLWVKSEGYWQGWVQCSERGKNNKDHQVPIQIVFLITYPECTTDSDSHKKEAYLAFCIGIKQQKVSSHLA